MEGPSCDIHDDASPRSESEISFVSAESGNRCIGFRHSNYLHKTTSDTLSLSAKGPNQVAHPNFRTLSSTLSPPAADPKATTGSYFAHQPTASGIEPRTPQNKRPPASRSSHGVGTSSGPPPSLSTRHSYTADSSWRHPPSDDPSPLHRPLALCLKPNHSVDSVVETAQRSGATTIGSDTLLTLAPGLPAESIMDAEEARNNKGSATEDDQDPTLRVNVQSREEGKHTRHKDGQQQTQTLHEDLFFDLARADSVADDAPEPLTRSERRLSRTRGTSMKQPRTSRPSSSGRLSTSGGGHLVQQSSTIQGHRYDSSFGSSNHYPTKQPFSSLQESSAEDDLHAASVHPLDQRHRIDNSRRSFSMLGGDEPAYDRSPGPPSISGRRRPMRDKSPGQESQAYKHSKFSFTSNGNYQSSAFTKDSTLAQNLVIAPQASHVEGTESTVSTTAPSTFWDELDDLKSRIRKLELTGKLPSSSNAAMSNVFSERPPTATTTVTTLSSSPNRFQQDSVSPEASTIKGAEVANIHPLLHSALAKTKPLIKAKLYKSLQATASDALTLAAMLCTTDSHEQPHTDSVVGSSGGINKQLHSNVNNMCRSLTQLCIALAENAENEPESSRSRPVSKNLVLGPQRSEAALQDQRLLRAASDEPELRSSSRVISRLEARRTSLLGSSPSYGQRQSPHQAATPAQPMPPVTSRLDRTASVLLRNRTNDGQMDSMNSRRPPSRAATEVGQIRMSAQTRASREYTSQHPGPNQADWSPSIPSSLPTRRNYFATGSQSPITPNLQAGTRRYLDFSTPPSSADSARFAEARQRRIASLGQHTSAGHSRIGIASGRLRQAEAEQQR